MKVVMLHTLSFSGLGILVPRDRASIFMSAYHDISTQVGWLPFI